MNGCGLKVYGLTWFSLKPKSRFIHWKYDAMPSLETNSVSFFRSSNFSMPWSGCASSTCGSFWKIAAMASVGMLRSTASNACSVFALM